VGRGHMAATSARRIWHGHVEVALRLDASAVVRAVRHQHPELWARWAATGQPVVCRVMVPMTRNGRLAGDVGLVVGLDGTCGSAGLPGLAPAPLSARLATPPGSGGGFKWSWRCPRLGHRCQALFLPEGEAEFLSREAHGLRHRVEGEGRMARLARKARKLRRRLGEDPPVIGAPSPARPLRMTARTYARLLDQLQAAEDHTLAVMAGLAVPRRASGA
jgi:hypothetical protein